MSAYIHTSTVWSILANKLPIEEGGSVPYSCVCYVYVHICMFVFTYILGSQVGLDDVSFTKCHTWTLPVLPVYPVKERIMRMYCGPSGT